MKKKSITIKAYERLLKRHKELIEKYRRLKEESMSIPPGRIEPSGDQEERFCETCGARMVVPGKSATTECSRCLDY